MADSPLAPNNAVQVVKHETGFGHYIQLGSEDVRLAENLILHEAQVVASVLNRHWNNFVAAFRRDTGAVIEEVAKADEAVAAPLESESAALEAEAEKLEHEGTPDAPATPTE